MTEPMPVVILAGGRGSRLEEETRGLVPKPLVTVGDRPILEHIITIYSGQGMREFVIAAGFKAEAVFEWALEFQRKPTYAGERILVSNTGLETQTGGRLRMLAELIAGRRFMLTYGDGLADVNLAALVEFHERMLAKHEVLATVTAVRPPSRWGAMSLRNGLAEIFIEKAQAESGWINGGFYVVEPTAVNLIPDETSMWEYDVLPVLAVQGRLAAYQHTGWWACMDTPRDRAALEEIWQQRRAPWARWQKP